MKRFNQLLKKCTNYMQNESKNGSGSSRFAYLSILSRQSVLTIFCLMMFGVGEVWGDAQFDEVYMTYTLNGGSESNYTFNANSGHGDALNNPTITSNLTITNIYMKYRKYNGNVCGGQLGYSLDGGTQWSYYHSSTNSFSHKSGSWSYSGDDKAGSEWYKENCGLVIASSTDASGEYSLTMYWQIWGSASTSSDCDKTNWYFTNNGTTNGGGSNFVWTYTILPPNVEEGDEFGVSASNALAGVLGGTGTEEDPFIISYGSSTQLTVTANKEHDDDNSRLKVSFDNGSNWTTAGDASTTTITSSSLTPTSELQNCTIKVKFTHTNGTLDCSTVSSRVIYYIQQTPGISVVAGSHGKVRKSTSDDWASSATISSVAASTAYNIYANPDTHYDFNNWTTSDDTHSSFANSTSASTTVTLSTGYSAVTTVTANFVEHPYSITISGGHVYGGEATSGSAGVSTTKLKIEANSPAAGKKFKEWSLGDGVTLADGYAVTSTVVEINATANATVTATYEDREHVKVYFAKPSGWTNVYAYAWKASGTANADYPGKQLNASVAGTGTETIKGTTYYYYKYYTDDGSDDAAGLVGSDTWDQIIFNQGAGSTTAYPSDNWNKTKDLTIADGHFYHCADGNGENGRNTATISGSENAEDWYVVGYFNFTSGGATHKWGFDYPIDITDNSGSVTVTGLATGQTQEFKVYRASTDEWFKYTGGADVDHYDSYPALINSAMTMRVYNNARNTFKTYDTQYTFALNTTSTSNPVLTVTPREVTPYSTTLSVSGHGSVNVATGTIQLRQYIPVTITATQEAGYRFTGWTTTGSISYVDGTNASSTTASFVATAAGGTITANFSNEHVVYLKKDAISGSWGGTPYVYFYSKKYWDGSGKGTGSKSSGDVIVHGPYAMERLNENEQIWYYDYSGKADIVSGCKTKNVIAFADHSMSDYDNFDACQAIYRSDFYPDANMFVVKDQKSYYNTSATKGQAVYYNEGYWMKFNDSDPGYVLKVYNLGSGGDLLYSSRFSGTAGHYTFTTTKNFTSADLYFELLGCDTLTKNGHSYSGTYYNNTGTMTSSNAPYGWTFYHNVGRCGLKASATGDYTFTLTCADGHLSVKVDFPVAIGDMRVLYNGKVSTTGEVKSHPSHFIRLLSKPTIASDSTQTDTIGFFIVNGSSPTIRYQRCDNFDGSGNPIWKDTIGSTYDISSFETGIYTFVITQNSHSGATANSTTCESKGLYSGDFYIRTDEAGGGWQGYASSPNSKMIQSDIALTYGGYDYYHCQWVKKSRNTQFTIANNYSECISDTLKDDDFTSGQGNLPDSASVRFMWNSSTNVIGRAYLSGSNDGEAEYLKIQSDPSKTATNVEDEEVGRDDLAGIIKSDGTRYGDNIATFRDLNNWVYQLDVKVKEGARIKLTSNYRYNSADHLQYFKGAKWQAGDAGSAWDDNHTTQILGGTQKKYQSLRIVYDFKTNQLLSAWLADGDPITGNDPVAINTDVIILREGQDDARQITFSGTGSLTEVDTVYGVISFNKWTLNNKSTAEGHANLDPAKSVYERDLYWISFPFDVKLNDVFGFGTYGIHWIIEYYDGKGRAKNGFWADSPSNWKFLPRDTILHANEGYILALDLDMLGESSKVWENSVEDVYLYFPSKESVGNIQATNVDVNFANQNAYKCTINRGTTQGDRRIKDSYWHCIGVPSYANTAQTYSGLDIPGELETESWEPGRTLYFYEWNSASNTLSIHTSAGYDFKAMYSYLVQYAASTLSWTSVTNTVPASVAARQAETQDRNYRLSLMSDSVEQDHTLMRLTDDAVVTNAFEFNYDLCKEYNAGKGNIWTVTTDAIPVAGNSMPKPVQTTVVPVGVNVVQNGEYTLSMPEGTNGENVILIDNAYGTRTNLGLTDYTVTLTSGTYDGRFALEFAPIQDSPTSLENDANANANANANADVRKVFVGGRLYILRDGKVYDAAGQRIE